MLLQQKTVFCFQELKDMPFILRWRHDLLQPHIKPITVYINLHTIQYTTQRQILLDNNGGFVVYFVHKVVISGVKWINAKALKFGK